MLKERISDLEDRSIEIMTSKEARKIKSERFGDIIKHSNIYITRVQERKEGEKNWKTYLKK